MDVTAAKATKIYPACAMELYASKRLTFVCTSAPKLPANIVSAASAQKAQNQKCVAAGTVAKIRKSSANAAAFGPAENKAVTGVGAPSYTSGVHTWKGAAATLKPRPIRISAKPSLSSVPEVSALPICNRF